jgi:uncharacterized protein YbbC (DUF1343 family)
VWPRATLVAALALAVPGCGPSAPAGGDGETTPRPTLAAQPAVVLPGIDVLLRDGGGPLAGRRVGLITNHTGLTADGRSTIDALHENADVQLVSLFGPEHGLRGAAEAGEDVASGRDDRTGLPVHSLYGDTNRPSAEMLADVDVLAFDIQDIGTRYYTYVWTMALAMRSAAENGKEFVVLDRPNPIGGALVQGNVLDTAYATFVGLHAVPMRHGMTAGEMAQLVNAEFDIGARLTVVPVEGWRRDAYYDETGLAWVAPSPNMPTLESAIHYPGTCLFEGVNMSVGRGTPMAFQQVGAPWLDAAGLIERMRARNLPGVRFEAVTFTPEAPGDNKYGGEPVEGVRLHVTDRATYDPTHVAVAMLVEIHAAHADSLQFLERHFDRLAGTDALRLGILAGRQPDALTATWPAQLEAFNRMRSRYLIY